MSEQKPERVIPSSYLPSLVIKCLLLFAAGVVLAALLFYGVSHQSLGGSYQESFQVLALLRKELLFRTVLLYTTVSLLVLAGIICLAVLYSHRVAGPMIRLTAGVRKIGQGELSGNIALRRGDVVTPVADELNGVLAAYSQRILELQGLLDGMKREVPPEGQDLLPAETRKVARALAERAAVMEKIVSGLRF